MAYMAVALWFVLVKKCWSLDEKMASRPDDAMTIAIACHDHSEIKFIIPCGDPYLYVYVYIVHNYMNRGDICKLKKRNKWACPSVWGIA